MKKKNVFYSDTNPSHLYAKSHTTQQKPHNTLPYLATKMKQKCEQRCEQKCGHESTKNAGEVPKSPVS